MLVSHSKTLHELSKESYKHTIVYVKGRKIRSKEREGVDPALMAGRGPNID